MILDKFQEFQEPIQDDPEGKFQGYVNAQNIP